MAYKELKKVFPFDIVDVIIVPYLLPSEKEIKERKEETMNELMGRAFIAGKEGIPLVMCSPKHWSLCSWRIRGSKIIFQEL